MKDVPSLNVIHDLVFSASKALTLKLALEMDLFSAVARGCETADEIAQAIRSSSKGSRSLLDALCGMGFLVKEDSVYLLTATSSAFLVRGKVSYYGDSYLDALLQWAWPEESPAVDAIRSGKGVAKEITDAAAFVMWESWCAAHAEIWEQIAVKAQAMWAKLDEVIEIPRAARVLDLACGHGIWTFALLQRDAGAFVTAMDRHRGVVDIALDVSSRMGVAQRVDTIIGDVRRLEVTSGSRDIVYIGGVLYLFLRDDICEIVRNAFAALNEGGLLIVNTMIADEGRCLDEGALVQAFRRLIYNGGDVPTFAEYRAQFADAGFSEIEAHGDGLIVARK